MIFTKSTPEDGISTSWFITGLHLPCVLYKDTKRTMVNVPINLRLNPSIAVGLKPHIPAIKEYKMPTIDIKLKKAQIRSIISLFMGYSLRVKFQVN
jgi:hypothetical protein